MSVGQPISKWSASFDEFKLFRGYVDQNFCLCFVKVVSFTYLYLEGARVGSQEEHAVETTTQTTSTGSARSQDHSDRIAQVETTGEMLSKVLQDSNDKRHRMLPSRQSYVIIVLIFSAAKNSNGTILRPSGMCNPAGTTSMWVHWYNIYMSLVQQPTITWVPSEFSGTYNNPAISELVVSLEIPSSIEVSIMQSDTMS